MTNCSASVINPFFILNRSAMAAVILASCSIVSLTASRFAEIRNINAFLPGRKKHLPAILKFASTIYYRYDFTKRPSERSRRLNMAIQLTKVCALFLRESSVFPKLNDWRKCPETRASNQLNNRRLSLRAISGWAPPMAKAIQQFVSSFGAVQDQATKNCGRLPENPE